MVFATMFFVNQVHCPGTDQIKTAEVTLIRPLKGKSVDVIFVGFAGAGVVAAITAHDHARGKRRIEIPQSRKKTNAHTGLLPMWKFK
jgi:hypothetical protein